MGSKSMTEEEQYQIAMMSDRLTSSTVADRQYSAPWQMVRQAFRGVLKLPLIGTAWSMGWSAVYKLTSSVYTLLTAIIATSLIRITVCFLVRAVLIFLCLQQSDAAKTFGKDIWYALLGDMMTMLQGGMFDYILLRLKPLYTSLINTQNKTGLNPKFTLMERLTGILAYIPFMTQFIKGYQLTSSLFGASMAFVQLGFAGSIVVGGLGAGLMAAGVPLTAMTTFTMGVNVIATTMQHLDVGYQIDFWLWVVNIILRLGGTYLGSTSAFDEALPSHMSHHEYSRSLGLPQSLEKIMMFYRMGAPPDPDTVASGEHSDEYTSNQTKKSFLSSLITTSNVAPEVRDMFLGNEDGPQRETAKLFQKHKVDMGYETVRSLTGDFVTGAWRNILGGDFSSASSLVAVMTPDAIAAALDAMV